MNGRNTTTPVIEITVNPKGETSIQSRGFTGASCKDATRAYEQALGTVQSDRPTAEMYQTVPAQNPARQSSGS